MSEKRSLRWPIWTAVVFVCVVIIYLGVFPQLASSGRPSPKSNSLRREQLHQFALGSVFYFSQYKAWPTNIANLYANGNERHVRIVNDPTNDAWGYPIIYEPFDTARGFGAVKSLGRDGKPGGTGLDQDIEIRFNANRVLPY